MATVKATVVQENEKYFIRIGDEDTDTDHTIRIPMSEDEPNEVKKAFNRLIVRLKEGEFRIELERGSEDLFSLVASEYIRQLNREIKEVYREMGLHRLSGN